MFRGSIYENDLNEAYEQIVYWLKIISNVPTGDAGKKFINKICRVLNLSTSDMALKNTVVEAIHIMPALLLQKPSKKSKVK